MAEDTDDLRIRYQDEAPRGARIKVIGVGGGGNNAVNRMIAAGVTVSIVLAVTGVAQNLFGFFPIVGASCGPICGAMAADYLLSGKRWAGPREGVNWAGYLAWALGFVVGILPFLPVSDSLKTYVQPAVLHSFVTGFVVYAVLAKAGIEPRTVAMPLTARQS